MAFGKDSLLLKSKTSNATPWHLASGQTEIWTAEGKFTVRLRFEDLLFAQKWGESPSTCLEEPRTLRDKVNEGGGRKPCLSDP